MGRDRAEPGRTNWYGSRKAAPVAQAADGTLDLPASKAVIHGEFLLYEKTSVKDNLGRWISPDDWASSPKDRYMPNAAEPANWAS